MDKAVFPGIQGGPLMHVIAAKAVAFKLALGAEFRDDQQRTIDNAQVLAATLAEHGATLVSGGTDNHLMLVDVTPLGVTGKEAEHLLDEVGITVNKNAIPFDPLPPNTASGIRVGSPATTTRGFGPAEMRARRASSSCARSTQRDDAAALGRRARRGARHLRSLPGAGPALTAIVDSAGVDQRSAPRCWAISSSPCSSRRGLSFLLTPVAIRIARACWAPSTSPTRRAACTGCPIPRAGGLAVGDPFVVVGIAGRGHRRQRHPELAHPSGRHCASRDPSWPACSAGVVVAVVVRLHRRPLAGAGPLAAASGSCCWRPWPSRAAS